MISSFRDKYRFLSNFYICEIELDGKIYHSVEHAYQASKTDDDTYRSILRESHVTAGLSKKIAKNFPLRKDWEEVKLKIMEDLLRQKFSQEKTKALLLSTGEEELIEG